jgi:hypothetical protein
MRKTFVLAVSLCFGLASFAENNIENSSTAATTEINQHEANVTTLEPEGENLEVSGVERRFSAITEVGSVIRTDKAYFSIYQVLGMRINPYVFIGQGLGVQVSKNKNYQLQATVDLRTYVLDKKVTPMFTVQAGLNKTNEYASNEARKLNDIQFLLNAGTGILVKAKENASFTINGGYSLYTDFNKNMHAGFVKVGYVF